MIFVIGQTLEHLRALQVWKTATCLVRVTAKDGNLVVMNRAGSIVVQDAKRRDRETVWKKMFSCAPSFMTVQP